MCFHFKSSPSKQDQFEKGKQPGKWTKFPEIKTEFPKVFSLRVKFPIVVCQCRYFWHNELQHIPRKPIISLSMPHNFAFTRVKLQSLIYSAHDRPISFKTVVIAEMLSILVDRLCYCDRSACRSFCSFCVCVFGAIAYAVVSRKTKDKDSKHGHLYPCSFFTRIFPWHICLEVVTLYTKLTVIGEYNKEQRG